MIIDDEWQEIERYQNISDDIRIQPHRWGSRGRKFESSHSDQIKAEETMVFPLLFLVFRNFFDGMDFAVFGLGSQIW